MRGQRKQKIADFYLGIFLVGILGFFKKGISLFTPNKQPPSHPSRVLFIKLAAAGDTILFLTIIKAYKEKYPQTKITMVASPINAEIVKNVPFIDEVLIFPLSGLRNILDFLKQLREKKFTLAIDGEQWSRFTPLMAFYAKINYTIGFRAAGQYRHYLYDQTVDHSQTQHEWANFQDLVKCLGIDNIEQPQFYFAASEIKNGEELWQTLNPEKKPLLIIHPGCGRHGWQRQWPNANYALLVKDLRKNIASLQVIITGGPEETEMAVELESMLAGEAINLAGKITLRELGYLISKADLFISGNTGPMHLAAAVKTPLIALHGPTNPQKWGPLTEKRVIVASQLSCAPCLSLGFEYGCAENKCMLSIPVASVTNAALTILGAKESHA